MGLVKRDLTGRTWVRMPADTSPLAKRHTPYAPAQDQITVTVTTSTATQVFVARKTTSIPKGVDFSAKRNDQAVINFDTLASFVRDSYRPRRARARARQAAAEAVNQQAAKEDRRQVMAKAFGLFQDKDVFPKDGLVYEREIREEW